MKNNDLILQRLQSGIEFLQQQEAKLMPVINMLADLANKKLLEEKLSFMQIMQIYNQLMEQQTNSIMLLTKIQEIIDYNENC